VIGRDGALRQIGKQPTFNIQHSTSNIQGAKRGVCQRNQMQFGCHKVIRSALASLTGGGVAARRPLPEEIARAVCDSVLVLAGVE